MELNLQRQPITINEVVYDGLAEHPIECDALLPDYCPDIVKILKCNIATAVGSSAVNGERVMLDGVATAHVYYASERGQIRHTEYKIPFSKTVDLRAPVSNPVITVMPSVDYVNCRAVNQRRLDIRGAITFKVKVIDQKEEQIISDAAGGGLQLRRDMMHVTELAGQHESVFAVAEELEIGYGKAPVGNVVRTECRVNVGEYKIIAGKVVAKADLLLHVCYQPVDSEKPLEVMEYSLPLSQIIDADGVDEQCVCDVDMHVTSCEVNPRQDNDGEYSMLSVDASIKAVVGSHRHMEIPVASDCYSTQYDCQSKQKRLNFIRLDEILRENVMHKATLDLPEGVRTVLDSWCDVDHLAWKCEQRELHLSLRLTVSMFTIMEDGEALYFEQTEEVEKTVALQNPIDNVHFDPAADIISCTYNIVGTEKIDIRCEILVKGCVYRPVSSSSIVEISIDENAEKVKERNKLYIYYADEGESIWDIAKRYNTSATAIWEENAANEDILPAKAMLLIPIL